MPQVGYLLRESSSMFCWSGSGSAQLRLSLAFKVIMKEFRVSGDTALSCQWLSTCIHLWFYAYLNKHKTITGLHLDDLTQFMGVVGNNKQAHMRQNTVFKYMHVTHKSRPGLIQFNGRRKVLYKNFSCVFFIIANASKFSWWVTYERSRLRPWNKYIAQCTTFRCCIIESNSWNRTISSSCGWRRSRIICKNYTSA